MNDKDKYERAIEKALGHDRHDDVPEEVRTAAQHHLESFRNLLSYAITSIHFSPFPVLEPGERILCMRHFVKVASGKSWPTYKCSFSLPPILDVGLYVTDRRIFVIGMLLRLLSA